MFVVICALGMYYTVAFVRVLPWVSGQYALARKPWACDVCMCGWAAITWGIGVYLVDHQVEAARLAASAGACLLLLQWRAQRPPPPDGLPF